MTGPTSFANVESEMPGIHWFRLVAVLNIAISAGCSGSSSETTGSATAEASKSAVQNGAASNPIAQAASDWLDAILKGDKPRASARLTPEAQQQIAKNNMEFAPPGGVQTVSFQIGEIRTPSQDQAIVQCVLNYNVNGKQQSEEACCLLRFVNNEWRVAGIAYGNESDKPWTLTNFETGKDVTIPRQVMSGAGTKTAATSGEAGRPSPPRTAQETPAVSPTAERR
jgi:hypothetical protein